MKNLLQILRVWAIVLIVLLSAGVSFAVEDVDLNNEQSIQKRINDVGVRILNANKINKRIVFTYDKGDYKKKLNDPALTRRQIIFYGEYFKYIENDDELAAFLAQQIAKSVRSYTGEWGGFVTSSQIKMAPKKYELIFDKRAVDYMVKAGYNPVGLITFMNKSVPQGMFDRIMFHNKSSKRLATVYEYIYRNYPYYLQNNVYLDTPEYQNFLLNSVDNRALLKEKIQTKSTKKVKYE